MNTGYTGHPDLPRLMQQEQELLERIKEGRFNSEGQRMNAKKELHELWAEMRRLQMQGR